MARAAQPISSQELLPADAVSHALGVLLRVAASLAILSCVLGAAGPYKPETLSERVGHGAQIVVLLDRSRSMDLSFANPRGDGVTLVRDSKGKAARRLLARFAANRPNDLIALMEFTNIPIRVMGFN